MDFCRAAIFAAEGGGQNGRPTIARLAMGQEKDRLKLREKEMTKSE